MFPTPFPVCFDVGTENAADLLRPAVPFEAVTISSPNGKSSVVGVCSAVATSTLFMKDRSNEFDGPFLLCSRCLLLVCSGQAGTYCRAVIIQLDADQVHTCSRIPLHSRKAIDFDGLARSLLPEFICEDAVLIVSLSEII